MPHLQSKRHVYTAYGGVGVKDAAQAGDEKKIDQWRDEISNHKEVIDEGSDSGSEEG